MVSVSCRYTLTSPVFWLLLLVITAHLAALGGNLGGVTSWLFGLDGGQLAGQLHLDVLVPVRGFKRCVDAANGFGESHRHYKPSSDCASSANGPSCYAALLFWWFCWSWSARFL